jgi:branched-chain amino acid transport system ATP-binding protein
VTSALLTVEDLGVVYGNARALSDVCLAAEPGEALAVLGANGAGKSSLGRAISGLTPTSSGRMWFDGTEITGLSATKIARLGLAYLPEGRGIFRTLTVSENLRVTLRLARRSTLRTALDDAYDLFPKLAERKSQLAATLSGGEQQMLALARVLVTRPKLMIADEPSLGLAPKIIDEIFGALARARASGTSIVLIEQYVHRALDLCDSAAIMRRGSIVWGGATNALGDDALTHIWDTMT